MKKFVLYSITFSIPFVLFIFCFELSLRQVPNRYSFKNDLIVQKGACIKHMVIGSSVAGDGINTHYLPDSTYNLSMPAQWFRLNKALLEANLDKLPNLESVIWGIAYQGMWSDEISDNGAFENMRGEENEHHLTCHNLYMDICFDRSLLRFSEFLSCSRLSWEKWYKYYILREDVISYDSLGCYKSGSILAEDRFENMASTVKSYTRLKNETSHRVYQENIQRMNDVADLCSKKGVTLHIVITPHYKEFCKYADFEQVCEMKSAIKSVADKWENVFMHDYFNDSRFVDEDFGNGNHLSYDYGATKFSKILNEDLYGYSGMLP